MEHVAFQYRKEIEKQLGASLPPMPEDGEHHLPAEVEVQLSQLAAQAAARLLQKDQAEAQQQQAAQEAQDPLVAMQREELQIKMQEVQRKAMKDQMDGSYKEKDLQLKAQQMMINAALKTDELDAKDTESEARYSMDILKQSMQHDYDNQKSDKQHVREMGKLGRQHGHERQRSAADAAKQQPEKAAPPKGDK
jgi:hypothetical protein